MTGGSLPAMTWQRLMTYAHQNLELKPIPGVEKPFLEEKEGEAEVAVAEEGGEADGAEAIERPPVMSARTAALLRAMTDLFRAAPRLTAAGDTETLSSL
jgi:penicillin-binding protein 1A